MQPSQVAHFLFCPSFDHLPRVRLAVAMSKSKLSTHISVHKKVVSFNHYQAYSNKVTLAYLSRSLKTKMDVLNTLMAYSEKVPMWDCLEPALE